MEANAVSDKLLANSSQQETGQLNQKTKAEGI